MEVLMSMYEDVKNFHKKFDLLYSGPPRGLPESIEKFRISFMNEELLEYIGAYDLDKSLDALVDLCYVAMGTAVLHGFDFDEAWRRVHEANMRKVRATNLSQSARSSLDDVVKPHGWVPPDLSDLVR
jgi:predicted HAD superfamily Cof-like phosphohydrolase